MTLQTIWRGQRVDLGTPASLALAGVSGREWYPRAADSVADYAERAQLEHGYCADVVAILSPRVSVAHNVKLAREYLATGTIQRGVMRARLRALWRYERDGIVSGPKVSAFARALRGDPDAVVIDAWVLRAYGLRNRPADLATARRRILALSRHLGWQPAETQAALWVGVRRAVGFHDPLAPLLLGGR